MSFTGQIYPDNTVGYFRIASSTGRQPIEPVAVGEFLIGAAAHCQLRFGDAGMPPVHTTLRVERDRVLLHAATTEPPILINGVVETECRLTDGDMLELGEHRLLFRLASAEQRITLSEEEFFQASSATTQEDPPAETMSNVEQLVDRLEEQLNLVEELTHSPDEAMVELLSAVANAGRKSQTVDVEETSDLQQVTLLIQNHQETSRIRIESLTTVLDNVVKQQKLIADTLSVLSDRIQSMDANQQGYSQRRASA